MSQDGWMIGIDSNSESYELYTGFKTRLAYGQVDVHRMAPAQQQVFQTINLKQLDIGTSSEEQTQEQPILQDWDLDIY